MNERKVKITFTETEKRVNVGMIAAVIAKKLTEGGKKNVKRTEVS